MKCDECGRQLLKNERTCPYCGRVYGPSDTVIFLVTILVAAAILAFLIYSGA